MALLHKLLCLFLPISLIYIPMTDLAVKNVMIDYSNCHTTLQLFMAFSESLVGLSIVWNIYKFFCIIKTLIIFNSKRKILWPSITSTFLTLFVYIAMWRLTGSVITYSPSCIKDKNINEIALWAIFYFIYQTIIQFIFISLIFPIILWKEINDPLPITLQDDNNTFIV